MTGDNKKEEVHFERLKLETDRISIVLTPERKPSKEVGPLA
jgi:hypothetical protein